MDFSSMRYTITLVFLGIASLFTGEIVTYVMLCFLVIILTNIYNVLKNISEKLDKTQ